MMRWRMLRAFICVICLLSISIRLTVSKSHSWLPEEEIFSENFFQLGEVAPSNRYSCHHDNRSSTNDFHLRGTSLGGFLVLEPWITPSLFYQFLGASDRYPGEQAIQHFAFDSITFCRVLGGEEANRQLRVHWEHWVTSEQIANLAAIGVETVRIPVADWMFEPYEPFTNGCWEGAVEQLNRVIALCRHYNLSVLLDLHAVRGSQNGLDNSGDTGHYEWIKGENDSVRFNHWALRGGDWAGNYDVTHQNYSTVNTSHLLHTLGVLSSIVERYRGEKAVIGVQPVNEPWWKIPFPLIQEFYWRSYNLIRAKAPHWLVLFHDSFRLSEEFWGEKSQSHFLEGCSHYAVDIHLYHAWAWDNPPEYFIKNACYDHNHLKDMEELGVPIVVGEWSLATDNCAMWLNGVNDNVPTYPKVKCDRVQCPDPYFPIGLIPNAPPDPTKGVQGPLGTGGPSYVEYGTCPVDRSYPDEVNVVRQISYAQLYSYDVFTHGFFFWNFRTELGNRWDYQKAVEKGWLPTDWSSDETRAMIASACYSSPSPPPSSAWLRWLIRVVAIVFLVACLALLLAVCLPQLLRHFHIVRSGYLPIHDTDRDTEER